MCGVPIVLAMLCLAAVQVCVTAAESSAKKGVGVWYFGKNGTVTQSLQALQARWCYCWSPTPEDQAFAVPPGVQFVPMIWSEKHVTPKYLALAKEQGDVLLGFNEPDKADQAKMSVELALKLWPKLMATGQRLGSPAVAANAHKPDHWFAHFMAGIEQRRLRVDFIALHWYGARYDAERSVKELRQYLEAVYKRYRKPIWLTEFSLKNWDEGAAPATLAQQAAFARKVLPMLESLPWLERYAWFCLPPDGSESWNLADRSGRLTLAGKVYAQVP